MITFKTLLETVYEPKSGDEKNFKDKHIVAKYKTPYDTESQFTSTATKAKRKADYNAKEDEQVYEAAVLHTKRADKEAVIVRAVDPNTGQSKARVVKRGSGEIKIGEALDPVGKHDADIDNDGDVDKSDKYLIARRKAIGKAIRKEEVEQIDEISPNTLHSYIKKAAPDVVGRTTSAVASNQSAETKKHASKLGNRIKGITAASGRLADKANTNEEVELDEAAKTDDHWVHISHAGNFPSPTKDKIVGYSRPSKDAPKLKAGANGAMRVGIAKKKGYMVEESEQIDEAFKIGAMKLKDGSTVTLTRESVDAFNKLFNQLNSANKAKMEERMLSGKAGFQEILGFAENI